MESRLPIRKHIFWRYKGRACEWQRGYAHATNHPELVEIQVRDHCAIVSNNEIEWRYDYEKNEMEESGAFDPQGLSAGTPPPSFRKKR